MTTILGVIAAVVVIFLAAVALFAAIGLGMTLAMWITDRVAAKLGVDR